MKRQQMGDGQTLPANKPAKYRIEYKDIQALTEGDWQTVGGKKSGQTVGWQTERS